MHCRRLAINSRGGSFGRAGRRFVSARGVRRRSLRQLGANFVKNSLEGLLILPFCFWESGFAGPPRGNARDIDFCRSQVATTPWRGLRLTSHLKFGAVAARRNSSREASGRRSLKRAIRRMRMRCAHSSSTFFLCLGDGVIVRMHVSSIFVEIARHLA